MQIFKPAIISAFIVICNISVAGEVDSETVLKRDPNIIANPGFEEIVIDKPENWDLFVMPQEGTYGRIDHEHVYDGKCSVVLHNSRIYVEEPANNWSQNIIADLAKTKLRVTGFLKTHDATEAALWIQCWSKRRLLHASTTSTDSPVYGTKDWTEIEMDITAPPGTQFITLRCVLLGRGTAWFDDVSISKVTTSEKQKGKKTDDLNISDNDDDGLADSVETNTGKYLSALNTGTDPDNPDSDSDGLSDKYEVDNGLDPTDISDAKGHVPNSEKAELGKSASDKKVNSSDKLADPTKSLIETNKAMIKTNEVLQDTNQMLKEQLLLLQKEISELRNQINRNDEVEGLKGLQMLEPYMDFELPAEKKPLQKRRVPPLVPHGFDYRKLQ